MTNNREERNARVHEYRAKHKALKAKLKSEDPPRTLTDFWIESVMEPCNTGFTNFSNIMRGISTKPRPDIIAIIDKYLEG